MKKKCFSSLWLLFSGLAVSNFSVFAQSPSEQKLVWQDDFGTFTEEGHYWVWDYSDISNPVKVEKTTKDGWTYELPYSIPGAEYQSPVYEEGTYCVAANVTRQVASSGTKWEWQSQTFYGKYPSTNSDPRLDFAYVTPNGYAPDHTYNGNAYGAMLFLNCGNEPNEVLYKKEILGLSNEEMTAKCYISNWSSGDYPVKIKLRVTDLNSGEIYSSDVVERFATQAKDSIYDVQTAWKEVSVTFELTGNNPRLLLEIISVAGGNASNKSGNDLILDDIQIWADSVPTTKPSNEEEIKIDKNLVWQDDFGTFTEEGHYWVWDYSDINNPVKVEKTTKDGWTYELPYSIPGAEYQSKVYGEGTYSVAANVTSIIDNAKTGTMWEWQAYTFYGQTTPKNYGKDYAPDHTSSMANAPKGYGAMLFLNCGNEANEVIYQKEIKGLSKGLKTAKCHISTWSVSDNPVKIKMRVTDLNSGETYTSETVQRFSNIKYYTIYDVQTAWKEVSVTFELTGSNSSLKLEIISVAGGSDYNKDGNDLILDDIQIWASTTDCNIESPLDENIQLIRNGEEEILSTDLFSQTLNPSYELVWFTSDDPSVEPNSTGKESVMIDRSKQGYIYYIAYKDGECYSNRAKVTVEFLSVPMPGMYDFYMEIGDSLNLNDLVHADDGYELIWFDSENDSVGHLSAPILVDVAPGICAFFYAQRMIESPYAQSEMSRVTITIREKTNVENVIANDDEIINVYTISGTLVKSDVKRSEALIGLDKGVYIVGNHKVVIK